MAKVHAICVPFPSQGHITPMLQLAKFLNSRNIHITFINTEYNHRRLLRSNGPNSLDGTPSFRFKTFPDGLPPSDADVTQDVPSLLDTLSNNCLDSFVQLVRKLNDPSSGSPPVSLIVSDVIIPFTLDASRQLGDLPVVFFWPASACSYLGYAQYRTLMDNGIVPFKDPSFMTDGSLDKLVDWLPSMRDARLKDLPSFIRTTDKNHPIVHFVIGMIHRASKSTILFNTFDALEHEFLEDISLTATAGPIYSVGPLSLVASSLHDDVGRNELYSLGSSLWKEDMKCSQWLDSWKLNSVIYVSFGSVTVMSNDQLLEFAWGLANSNHPFLWVVRPDIVMGETAILPTEFRNEVKERSLLVSWCNQENVLKHPAIGASLIHSGWNSTLECLIAGVPVICWPFFADQPTNCCYLCGKWGMGVEIGSDVKRKVVDERVREVMEGEKGKEMRRRASEWKRLAEEATKSGGSSCLDGDIFVNYVLSLV